MQTENIWNEMPKKNTEEGNEANEELNQVNPADNESIEPGTGQETMSEPMQEPMPDQELSQSVGPVEEIKQEENNEEVAEIEQEETAKEEAKENEEVEERQFQEDKAAAISVLKNGGRVKVGSKDMTSQVRKALQWDGAIKT